MGEHIRFKVSGVGAFPLDMLRYCNAWPDSDVDASVIHHSIEDTAADRWTVTLVGHRVAHGRWESFLCRVTDSATREG